MKLHRQVPVLSSGAVALGFSVLNAKKWAFFLNVGSVSSLGALASLHSTGAQRTGSQEPEQHQTAKSTP